MWSGRNVKPKNKQRYFMTNIKVIISTDLDLTCRHSKFIQVTVETGIRYGDLSKNTVYF